MSNSDELRPGTLNLGEAAPPYPIETMMTQGRKVDQPPEVAGKIPPQAGEIEEAVLGATTLCLVIDVQDLGGTSIHNNLHQLPG